MFNRSASSVLLETHKESSLITLINRSSALKVGNLGRLSNWLVCGILNLFEAYAEVVGL